MNTARSACAADDRAPRAIAEYRAGHLSAAAMVDTVRASTLVVLVTDEAELLVADVDSAHWLLAFTSESELARFTQRRGEGGRIWEYATVRASRLLDAILSELPQPAAVAVDIGGPHPMLLPASTGEQSLHSIGSKPRRGAVTPGRRERIIPELREMR